MKEINKGYRIYSNGGNILWMGWLGIEDFSEKVTVAKVVNCPSNICPPCWYMVGAYMWLPR